ncbi:orotidine 5'-phosphate decarboxylase [Clostridia bacterium]|nr:orotidine 5'-phosphate decarboxylase [Clostridia bacterium]
METRTRTKGVIIACDFPNKTETMKFLSVFPDRDIFVKIGMELFYGEGPSIVEEIKSMGYRIFLDLKLHDTPNTVKKAMKNIAKLGVDMTTIHAAGGKRMMLAAKEGLLTSTGSTLLLAVTVLTSLSEDILKQELLIQQSVEEVAIHYAKNAQNSGADGVICSPLETKMIKLACGDDFVAVTPGIRYAETNDDQSRVATPAMAKTLGSDFIVVGRPITAAVDPVAVYSRILADFLGDV